MTLLALIKCFGKNQREAATLLRETRGDEFFHLTPSQLGFFDRLDRHSKGQAKTSRNNNEDDDIESDDDIKNEFMKPIITTPKNHLCYKN
jgi:hypothetical protein